MAIEDIKETFSVPAAANLSADQNCFMLVGATVAKNTVAGGRVDGVLLNKPSAAGQAAAIATRGIVKVRCGAGGFTAGGRVMSDNAGRAVAWVTKNYWNGVALETSTAADQVVSVKLNDSMIDEAT